MFLKKLKKVSILASVLFLLSTTAAFADVNVSRIAGANRYDTAMKVEEQYFNAPNGNLAIIAPGNNFRMALYGSYMANALKVPYYVIPNTGLSKSMVNELSRLHIKRAYVIGDYKLLNKNVDNSLISNGVSVNRLYDKVEGGDRIPVYHYVDTPIFDTFHNGEPRGDVANGILINDKTFPDLLASIPFLSELTRKDATFLGSYQDFDIDSGYRFIIGGYNTVPGNKKTYTNDKLGLNLHYANEEKPKAEESFYTGRIAGHNRYQTAVAVADSYSTVLKRQIDTVILVDGTNYPDALASGTVATQTNGAILLTEPNKLNGDTKDFIQNKGIKNVIIVGGEKSVSKNVENEIRNLK